MGVARPSRVHVIMWQLLLSNQGRNDAKMTGVAVGVISLQDVWNTLLPGGKLWNSKVPLFTYAGCSARVRPRLRLHLLLSCGPGEAISIKGTETEQSRTKQNVPAAQRAAAARLWFVVDGGVWQRAGCDQRRHHSNSQLHTYFLCGPMHGLSLRSGKWWHP